MTVDVTTADEHGHWDVADIRALCVYRDLLKQDRANFLIRLYAADEMAKAFDRVLIDYGNTVEDGDMDSLYEDGIRVVEAYRKAARL